MQAWLLGHPEGGRGAVGRDGVCLRSGRVELEAEESWVVPCSTTRRTNAAAVPVFGATPTDAMPGVGTKQPTQQPESVSWSLEEAQGVLALLEAGLWSLVDAHGGQWNHF
jgi:hypothetical protein